VLDELVDGAISRLAIDSFTNAGLAVTIADFVEWQAQFFRVESLVFRTALSRLPEHQPLRAAYRRAEELMLTHLDLTFAALLRSGHICTGTTTDLAEAFMIAAQGINNPRAWRPDAREQRAALARGISGMLAPEGD
jgi:hypothetical protein